MSRKVRVRLEEAEVKFSGKLILTVAVLLAAGACRPGGELTSYDKVPTAPAGDGKLTGELAGGLVVAPVVGNWPQIGGRMMVAARDGRVAGMLFDLKGLPQGAAVSKAVLRMRRQQARGNPRLWVMDVRRGLHVKIYAEGEPIRGIARAKLTTDKRAIMALAREEEEGREISGLALGAYPVECTLRGVKYTPKFLGSGKRYGKFLEEWNSPLQLAHAVKGAWDEIDVTELVRGGRAGDSLLLAVAASKGDVSWFGSRKGREWAAPRLVVVGAGAAAPAEPTPTPKPKPKPEPPVEKPAVSGRGKLVISSKPERADLYVDGKYVGTTPSRELSLPAGPVKVRIEKKGYKTWERSVTVLKDNTVSVAPELEKE
ncbi:MAG: PEGA domain-containing protein [Planctomycetota bacterium]